MDLRRFPGQSTTVRVRGDGPTWIRFSARARDTGIDGNARRTSHTDGLQSTDNASHFVQYARSGRRPDVTGKLGSGIVVNIKTDTGAKHTTHSQA